MNIDVVEYQLLQEVYAAVERSLREAAMAVAASGLPQEIIEAATAYRHWSIMEDQKTVMKRPAKAHPLQSESDSEAQSELESEPAPDAPEDIAPAPASSNAS